MRRKRKGKERKIDNFLVFGCLGKNERKIKEFLSVFLCLVVKRKEKRKENIVIKEN